MPHPRVKRMRERLGELLELALEASDRKRAERILYAYERRELSRRETIERLQELARKSRK